MNEKLIEFNQEKYLVTTGELKLIEGTFTKEELSRIYQLRDLINITNQEIKNINEQFRIVEIKKKIYKGIPKLRLFAITVYIIATIIIAINTAIIVAIVAMIIYALLYCLIEKCMKILFGTKEQNEIEENNINNSLNNKQQQLKEYEKELTKIIEKTKYQETSLDEETTIKPIDHSLDNKVVKVSNLSRIRKTSR